MPGRFWLRRDDVLSRNALEKVALKGSEFNIED
jgi:hypothetical protein